MRPSSSSNGPSSPQPARNFEFRLDQADRGHNLGRFRLSVTSSPPPIQAAWYEREFHYSGEIPPTKTRGILAVSVELKQGPHPLYLHQREGHLKFAGLLNEHAVTFEPVVGNGWYPAPWQAWRLTVAFSDKPRRFEFQIGSDLATDVEYHISAHFVPR